MKTLMLLLLLLIFIPSGQKLSTSQENSSVVILGFKWSKTRQTVEPPAPAPRPTPAAEIIPANKVYQRSARVNNPVGARDPNEDTIDGRSAALEKLSQEARTRHAKPVDGYAYRVKVQNADTKVIEILFWEYQFIDPMNPANITRRQFLCGVNIKANKEKEVLAFSASGPSEVVSVKSLAGNGENPFQEKVLINRVEYSDGTIWQRKDWKFAEIRLTYQRAVATPWGSEMCRGL